MDKRESIIEAMLDLVVERGFHNAPMSLVAKRAKVSAGVIYHYFSSKEDIIHAVFVRFKDLKRRQIMEGYESGAPLEDSYCRIFENAYDFYRSNRREARFYELYENSPFCTNGNGSDTENGKSSDAELDESFERDKAEFLKKFASRKHGGILKDIPTEAIHEFSFGLAFRLAKHETAIEPAILRKIAESSWTAIADE